METYTGKIISLKYNEIFVFGSNTQGYHGGGWAKYAFDNFGAIRGQAEGRQGQSYAIITKDLTKKKHPSVSKNFIIRQISVLYDYLNKNKDIKAYVAYSGTGKNLNKYTSKELAGFFYEAGIIREANSNLVRIPNNIVFEKDFYNLIREYLIS